MSRRLAAVLALVATLAGLVGLVVNAVQWFPNGLLAIGLLVVAAVAAFQGLIRTGVPRTVLWVAGALALIAAVVALVLHVIQYGGLGAVILISAGVVLARQAFSVHLHLPPAQRPQRAVVVYNPKSGGGKATTFHLADEARKRGIEPIELKPGDDLVVLVKGAVARGADALAAAGGDGTQALVATIAAENDLPFACIPAGTRNHFALDLGVDRDDVVGALDAFVDGGEKRVDLGLVGGRTFVNNCSLGLYAEAVQQTGYRDAKLRTLLETASTQLSQAGAAAGPRAAGPGADSTRELRWTDADGRPQSSAAVILVSNNVYRLGTVIGSGTRPRMDAGQLGIAVMLAPAGDGGRRQPMRQWSAPTFVIDSDGDVPVGVDGEALVMPTPLEFTIRPAALRVRIAPHHPGASPAATLPSGFVDAVKRLWRIAGGQDPAAFAA